MAGIKPEDLYGLKELVQVADLLIAPSTWFNPPHESSLQAKGVHNFRGSWKTGAD